MKGTVVLGIGNLLLGDEGVGVHAARELEERLHEPGVEVVDGGTGGFHLLEYFQVYERILLIDAAADGYAPGTVREITPRYASDFPRTLAAHDLGLKDLLEAAQLLGRTGDVTLITVSIGDLGRTTLELSEPVRAALPEVVRRVEALVGVGA